MKLNSLKEFTNLFNFKTVTDKNGNEYVFYANSGITEIGSEVEDKTQFEALENHVHLFG